MVTVVAIADLLVQAAYIDCVMIRKRKTALAKALSGVLELPLSVSCCGYSTCSVCNLT